MESNPYKYILTYDESTDFLENAHGNTDKTSLASEYSPGIKGISSMLNEL